MPQEPDPGLLNVAEVSALLRTSPSSIRRMAKDGEIEAVRVRGKVYYRLSGDLRDNMGVRDEPAPATDDRSTVARALEKTLEALEREQRMHQETVSMAANLAAQVSTSGILARNLEQLTQVLTRLLQDQVDLPPVAGHTGDEEKG